VLQINTRRSLSRTSEKHALWLSSVCICLCSGSGTHLCPCLSADIRGDNPSSRLVKSKYKTLKKLRDVVVSELRMRAEYRGQCELLKPHASHARVAGKGPPPKQTVHDQDVTAFRRTVQSCSFKSLSANIVDRAESTVITAKV
jgi:hypothetical protein